MKTLTMPDEKKPTLEEYVEIFAHKLYDDIYQDLSRRSDANILVDLDSIKHSISSLSKILKEDGVLPATRMLNRILGSLHHEARIRLVDEINSDPSSVLQIAPPGNADVTEISPFSFYVPVPTGADSRAFLVMFERGIKNELQNFILYVDGGLGSSDKYDDETKRRIFKEIFI